MAQFSSYQMTCSLIVLVGMIASSFFLLLMSTRLQYFAKMFTFLLLSFFAVVLPVPLMLRRPRDYRNAL